MRMKFGIISVILAIGILFTACGKVNDIKGTEKSSPSSSPLPSTSPIPSLVKTEEVNSNVSKLTIDSKVLGKVMKVNIYLPKGYSDQNEYPVLYMFHGYSSSEDTWIPGLQLDVKASELIEAGKINPLIIVCPDMENSYGINSSPKYSVIGGSNRSNNLSQGMFEDYFIKELIPFIDANYSTDARMESRYAGGLSMGGFISLYFAFNHPDMFSKVGGHSPALFMDELPNRLGPWLYPNDETRKERDPIEIAREKDLSALSVYLDCGDKDSYRFYEGCEKLYSILKENNVKAQYSLNPGEHTGEYWRSHSEEYLLFYAGKEN